MDRDSPPRAVDSRSPCERHACCLCCIGTVMTLEQADVRRLEGAGARDFVIEDEDGFLHLATRDGACLFLLGGACTVYADRPAGCRLYPLILDLGLDRPVLDDVCPHRHEFRFAPADEAALRRSVEREEAEAERRRR